MPIQACTTPLSWGSKSDLDSYIRDFAQDHLAAWEGVKPALPTASPTGAPIQARGRVFDYLHGKTEVFTPLARGSAPRPRDVSVYRQSALDLPPWRLPALWGGVLTRRCAGTSAMNAGSIVSMKRSTMWQVATRLEEEPPPDCQYINVRNGQLQWAMGTLEPHTSTVFTTVQLPIEYDLSRPVRPLITTYTTFEPDDIPLIEEILGWCLVPDRRFEKSVMLTGEGKTARVCFLDLVGYLLGETTSPMWPCGKKTSGLLSSMC